MFNLILFGPPGSGKGTQAQKIKEHFNFEHISTGDMFRHEMKTETELGKKVKSIIERGELVPDEILIQILENTIQKHLHAKGIIFDGFPRTLPQAEGFDKLLNKINQEVDLVLALDVNDNELMGRLLNRAEIQGRKDDTKEVIQNRLEVYKKQTLPLIEYYKKQNKYQKVDGVGSIDDIFKEIYKVVNAEYNSNDCCCGCS